MNFNESDLLLHCTLLAMMFFMIVPLFYIGMGELILVENFVHCGLCGVSGVGWILGPRGRCTHKGSDTLKGSVSHHKP